MSAHSRWVLFGGFVLLAFQDLMRGLYHIRPSDTTAIVIPCLLFVSFLLFARGSFLLSALSFGVAFILLLAFPHWIAVRQSLSPEVRRGGWISSTARYAVFMWFISQPELMAFQDRVTHGGALWNWWLITPLAVLTGSGIYIGLSRVSEITDQAIYDYLSSTPSAGVKHDKV